MNMGNWAGYLLAAIYYYAEHHGYGIYYCNIMGYLNIIFYYGSFLTHYIDDLKVILFPELADVTG